MRTKFTPLAVAALAFAGLSPGCLKDPGRDVPADVADQGQPEGAGAGGANAGGAPGNPLRETSANVTLLPPGVLSSPDLPFLPTGGYYRILTLEDANEKTGFTFKAANTTGYGLFAASSPRLVEDDTGHDAIDPRTTLNPVWLDGTRTAGAYDGWKKDLVLRPNTGGKPVLLSGHTSSALVAALLTVADGQSVTVPHDDIRPGTDVLWLGYEVGGGVSHHFVLVPATPPGPKLTVSDAAVAAGDKEAVFTISLSAAAKKDVTVRYATVSGTAAAGADFTAADGTLTFRPGETKKAVAVALIGPATRERDVDFFVTLASATHAVIADGVGLGIIRGKTGGRSAQSPSAPARK